MYITSTDYIPGYQVTEIIGVVEANNIQARHMGKDLISFLRTIIGGELTEYKEMLDDAREKAKNELIEIGKDKNADAIINIRYSTSAVMQGAAEILCYGTAVKLKKD
ncbi:MAG: YbjQ family protein [Bacillota bacterium]